MKTLEEMKARVTEILAKLGELNLIENHSDEDVTEVNTLSEEFEGLKAKIETKEKLEATLASANVSNRKVNPANPDKPRIEVIDRFAKTGGFETYGSFAKAVAQKSTRGLDDRRFQNAMFEGNGEDGGLLIPKEFMSEIQTKFDSQESLLARTNQFSINGNHLSMPVDEEQPWNGGVQAYWVGEGTPYTQSKGVIKDADFKLKKLGALVIANDEILEDSAAIESMLRKKAPAAMVAKVNNAIVSGDGVAKPTGFLNSAFKYSVAKEVAQAADTINFQNILKMDARTIPGGSYVWIVEVGCKEQLRTLEDSNGNLIYLNGGQFANLSAPAFDTLYGKPVIYMPSAARALGDEGDISLVDLSYYYSLVKTNGIQSSFSTHLYFDRDQTAFKFTMKLDGHCPFSSPVQSEHGNFDMSGFITLAERA